LILVGTSMPNLLSRFLAFILIEATMLSHHQAKAAC